VHHQPDPGVRQAQPRTDRDALVHVGAAQRQHGVDHPAEEAAALQPDQVRKHPLVVADGYVHASLGGHRGGSLPASRI
jgi:hypothetical protein